MEAIMCPFFVSVVFFSLKMTLGRERSFPRGGKHVKLCLCVFCFAPRGRSTELCGLVGTMGARKGLAGA